MGRPLADQWGALRAQSLAWQPFERGALSFALQGDSGLMMAWDASALEEQLTAQGLALDKIELIPEPALCKPPEADGLRLLQLDDGFEGQFWQANFLKSSRWWPELPGTEEWLDFARASGASPGGEGWDECPSPQVPELLDKPWLALRRPGQQLDQVQRAERWLIGGAGLALLFASMPLVREHWELYTAERVQQERLAALKATTAPIARLQDQARQSQIAAEQLVSDLRGIQPFDVFRYLSEHLPKEGVLLRELDLEGRKLRLVFELAPGVSRSSLVERMQAGAWFKTVAEQQGAPQLNWVAYQVELGDAPPLVAAAASQAASGGARP